MNSFVIFARRVALSLLLAAAAPVIAGGLSLTIAGPAAAAVASSITVKGNQRIEAETIKTYIAIKPGKAYGPAEIDTSIKTLFDTGLFADVSIAQHGSVLVVTVVENPVINSVTFQGNKKFKAPILTQVIEAKPRGVLTDARLQSDVNRVKEYYARSGRNGATVEAKVNQLADNRVDLIFVVNEGTRTGVGTITFVGNHAFSASRLTGIIQTRKSNWMSWLNKKDVYSEEKLQADQELLRRFYLSHGYADFQVLSAEGTFDTARGKYVVTYTVDEGPKYAFGTVAVDSSIQGVDGTSLMAFVQTKSGRVFNSSQIEKSTEALTIELARLGYVFAQVRPRGDRDYTNNLVSLTYVIDEGPRAYVERIEVREPGSAPDKVVIVVNVEDQSTGSLSVSAGLSTSDGLIGEVALEETNFLGRGQTVRVSVGGDSSGGKQTYNLSFTDPYFLGTRVSAGFDAYHSKTKDAGGANSYSTEANGGGLRLGLPLTDNLSAQLNYKIASVTTSGAVPPASIYYPNATRLTSSAGYTLTYSTLDNRLDPKEGMYFKLAEDFAGIGGDAKYIRTTGDARLYHPVLPDSDMIGMLKVTGGNITGIGAPVATADNFFKGGETVRGFAPLGYGPRDTTGVPTGGLAVGGKNFVAGTAEVTFPLPLMPPDFGLRGAVFADAGMLWGNDVPAGGALIGQNDMAVRSSVGGSIIWASPFGQIRADFAQTLTKQSYDQTQFFRLGAGTSF